MAFDFCMENFQKKIWVHNWNISNGKNKISEKKEDNYKEASWTQYACVSVYMYTNVKIYLFYILNSTSVQIYTDTYSKKFATKLENKTNDTVFFIILLRIKCFSSEHHFCVFIWCAIISVSGFL